MARPSHPAGQPTHRRSSPSSWGHCGRYYFTVPVPDSFYPPAEQLAVGSRPYRSSRDSRHQDVTLCLEFDHAAVVQPGRASAGATARIDRAGTVVTSRHQCLPARHPGRCQGGPGRSLTTAQTRAVVGKRQPTATRADRGRAAARKVRNQRAVHERNSTSVRDRTSPEVLRSPLDEAGSDDGRRTHVISCRLDALVKFRRLRNPRKNICLSRRPSPR